MFSSKEDLSPSVVVCTLYGFLQTSGVGVVGGVVLAGGVELLVNRRIGHGGENATSDLKKVYWL
jgi:hypothetical protein